MKATNIEIKARSSKAKNDEIRSVLRVSGAFSHGIKHQVDTYFKTEKGLLKLRECNDKMSLIFYIREDSTGPKQSNFITYDADRSESLKAVLAASYGVWKVIDKKREILSIDNVTFHLDEVVGLGTFMEIEALDEDGSIGAEILTKQCNKYLSEFEIADNDLLEGSYSDMI